MKEQDKVKSKAGRKPKPENLANKLQLYKAHSKQQDVHNEFNREGGAKFVTVVAGRQSGKSVLSMMQCVMWFLSSKKDTLIWWVSPTDSQTRAVQRQIIETVRNIEQQTGRTYIESSKAAGGQVEIISTGQVRIEFKSASSEDSLRGGSVDYLIVDEASFVKENTLNYILLPTLTVKGKKCLIVSTPKGKNWVYSWYQKGLDSSETNFASFKFTSRDNPLCDLELVEQFRRSLPEAVFAQEFMAEFVDSASVFRNVHIDDDAEITDSLFAGLDFGMLNDYTVLTVLNSRGRVVYVDRFRQLEATEMKQRIASVLKKWNITKCLAEQNNQGLPIIQDLVNVWGCGEIIVPWKTTGESKPQIINQLVNAFAENRVTIKSDPEEMKKELDSFVFNYTDTGRLRYEAPPGSHDDCVISLALGYECLQQFKNYEFSSDEVFVLRF